MTKHRPCLVTIQRTASALNCNTHAAMKIGFADGRRAGMPSLFGRRSTLRSGRRKADSHWLSCDPRQARGSALGSNRPCLYNRVDVVIMFTTGPARGKIKH